MKSMKETFKALLIGSVAMISMAISASDSEPRHVMIQIDKSGDNDAIVDLNVDGNVEAFALPELAVGETKTITTESGKEIVVSKTEDGLEVTIDGQNLDLPSVHGNFAAKIHRSAPLRQFTQNTVQVVGVELDDNQKQIIKDAFRAAGIEKEVSFSDHSISIFNVDEGFEFITDDNKVEWSTDGERKFEVIVDDGVNSEIKVKRKHVIIEKKD